jgi:sarcosine oxidase subunit beta
VDALRKLNVDVAVIGCGVIGASVACALAERGSSVVILEKAAIPATGSSGKAAGGIRAQFETARDVISSLYSIGVYQSFEKRYGTPIDYRRYGYLFITHSENGFEKYGRRVAAENALGAGSRVLSASEVGSLVPELNTADLAGGTFNPGDGYLDTNAVITGFLASAKKHGAKVLFNEKVVEIPVQNGRVTGVKTASGLEVNSKAVVLCGGPWSREIASLVGLELPLRTCKRQIFVTGPFPKPAPGAPFVIDEEEKFYFRREGAGVIMSVMEVEETSDLEPCVDWKSADILAERASNRFPPFADVGFSSAWAGIRTLTPDMSEILGSAGPKGFFLACGMSGHGFCHAPAVGAMLADAVRGEKLSGLDITPYLISRLLK